MGGSDQFVPVGDAALFPPQGTPLAAVLPFFNFSSDLPDEPAVQQVCDLFQQLWN